MLSALESAELIFADEDELTEIRNGNRLKMKLKRSSTDVASFRLTL
jgi:hypothetical protein